MARSGVRGTFSQAGPSRPAAAVRLARTLGVSQTATVPRVARQQAPHAATRALVSSRGRMHSGPVLRLVTSGCSPSVAMPPPAASSAWSPASARADSRFLFSAANSVATRLSFRSFHPRPAAPPNLSLKRRPTTAGHRAGNTLHVYHRPCRPGVPPQRSA